MRTLSLKAIGEIRTGMFGRTVPDGTVAYLQSKDFESNGSFITPVQFDLQYKPSIESHLLRKDDVLFAAKGTRNFGAVFDGSVPAVASTSFFVISIKNDEVLPEFLAWSLNNSVVQAKLKRHAVGSSIVSISKSMLETIELSVPTIENQRRILEIDSLIHREQELRMQIAELRRNMIERAVARLIK